MMSVRQTAGFPLLLSRELIVCFKVKVRNSATDPPSGVLTVRFALVLQRCGTIVCVVWRGYWLT